jgi:hypothetical protein
MRCALRGVGAWPFNSLGTINLKTGAVDNVALNGVVARPRA